MSEQPTEPYDIAIARRQLAERKAQLAIIEAHISMRLLVIREISEIESFLADWEAGNISE